MFIQGKILTGVNDLSEVFTIRRTVFVHEQGIPEDVEFDDLDTLSMHVLVYEETKNNKPVATGRIYFDGSKCEIGHIAVLKEYRDKKYGDFTVRMLLNKAFTAGIHQVYCMAPENIAGFFRSIGFNYVTDENDIDLNDINEIDINRNVKKVSMRDGIYRTMSIGENDIITICKKLQ